jgi:hypothetical protein
MLLLPAGQMGEAWEPCKEQSAFGNRGALHKKVLSLFSFNYTVFRGRTRRILINFRQMQENFPLFKTFGADHSGRTV